ncbi:MAG TPA: hypothetical protein VIZ28_06320 [Chitinophagaceae bacterium]
MKSVRIAGFRAGLLAFIFTISYCIVQLLQVRRVIPYPFDEILIYGTSLCIVIPFIIEILALHYITPPEKRFWTHAAIVFTTLYAVFVTSNYVVQLATVIPMKLKGSGNEISILEQTPHSLFWDFDALGYIFMGIAMLFAVPALDKSRQQKYARASLLANGLVTPLITIVYFYPDFSEKLLALGYPWAITAPLAMLTLAFVFKRNEDPKSTI